MQTIIQPQQNCRSRIIIPRSMQHIDVFVYCGGKAGSSTLLSTFLKNGYKTLHCHGNYHFRERLDETDKLTIYDVIRYNQRQNRTIFVIDSYRTPIEQQISVFFQNIHSWLPQFRTMSLDQIIEAFNRELFTRNNMNSIDEVMSHFQIPLFDTFDFEQKYTIRRVQNMVFVKLRFSNIGEWSTILSRIFNRPIVMHNENLTERKAIYPLYQKFKEQYKVPIRYLRDVLSMDNQFRIYNTMEEQDAYIDRWIANSVDA